MQNTIQKVRQSSIVFEKPGIYFVWKFENFDKLQLPYHSIFFAETLHMLPITNVYKRVFGIFLFCLDLVSFAKLKRPGFYTLVFNNY